MSKGKLSPLRIEKQEQATRAITLRAQGQPWEAIARAVGYPSPDAARMAVTRALTRNESQAVESLRAEEDEALRIIRQAATPGAMQGDPQSMAVLIRVSESRRKLYGVDMPISHRVDITGEEEELAGQIVEQINERIQYEIEAAQGDNTNA